jgi:large repetitive protein
MYLIKQIFCIACVTLVLSFPAKTQDVFTFVAGKKASATVTGDYLHQYDYWIKPSSTSSSVTLQIFDGGLGGVADVITGSADTKTTFQLFLYDSLKTDRPIQVLVTNSEQKYINRWYTIAALNASIAPNGWILRVSAGDGDDANAFKLNLVNSKGISQIGKDWMIYSYELPLCLFGINENDEVQVRPHPAFARNRTNIRSFGEEYSTIFVRDIFGQTSRLPIDNNFLKTSVADIQNQWGVSISGSSIHINNLVVRSKSDTAIIWEWMPTIVQKPKMPAVSILRQAGVNCNSVRLSVSETTRRELPNFSPIWVIGDTKLNCDSALIEFPKAGIYNAQVLLPTSGFYFPKYWLNDFTININAPPVAVITGAQEIVSPGETLYLSAKDSHDPEGSPLQLQWFINNESRGNQPTLHFSSLIPGLYEIKLIVNDGASNSICDEAIDSKTVRVNAQPYAEINGPRIHGRSVESKFIVKNDFDSDGDVCLYTWSGPEIVGSNKQRSVIVKHDKAGIYQISLTVNDQTGTTNASYSTMIEYRVNADPVPAFTIAEQAAPNDEIQLNAINTMDPDSRNLTYHWSVSNGVELDSSKATISFNTPGDYSVTLKVDDGEGVENSVQSYSRNIHINAPPVPRITAIDHSTSGRQIISAEKSYDGDQKVLKYTWNFGDGNTGTGKSIVHVFQKSGRYTITLTADDGQKQTNSIQSTTHLLVINKYPTARFNIPAKWEPRKPLLVDGTLSSDPDGEVSNYTWLINGKEVAHDSINSLIFPEPGDYAVALRVTDNSGFEDAIGMQTATIHVNYPPVVKWRTTPSVTEENELVTFDAKGTNDPDGKIKNVTWRFSDSTILSGMKVTKAFKKPGMMNVRITADDGAGFSNSVQSKDFNILVNNHPIIVTKTFIRSNSQVILLDASQSYDIDGQALKFDWLLSDGTHRHESSFYWETPKGGVHFISLSVDDGQGKKNSIARESIRLIVNRPPIAVVDSIIYSCTGMTLLLNGSLSHDPDGDPITTQWEFGDGTSSSETNPAHIFIKPGFYTVKLILSDGFADKPTVATIPVIIEGSPQAFQSFSDTTICVNTSLTFDGTRSTDPNGPLGSYSWDFGDGTNALGSTVTHAYSKPGTYYVTLTVVGNGSGRCSKVNQAISTIHIVEGPTADFVLPEAVSIGEVVKVDASPSRANGKILSTTWEARCGDLVITKEGTQAQFKFEKSGLYAVNLTITIETSTNCSSSSVVKNIRVNAPPVLTMNVPKDIALGDLLVMDGSKSYDPDGILTEFLWTLDGNKVGNTPIVSLPMTTAGDRTANLRITDNSGTSTRSVTQAVKIHVNSKPNPMFTMLDPLYESETIKLEPDRQTDSDEDTLSFIWKIDGTMYSSSSITFPSGRHTITLIANDGRRLSNSIDSVQKDVFVIPKPDLKSIDLPKDWMIGGEMNIGEITNLSNIGYISDFMINKTWLAKTIGDQTVVIGWAPRKDILTQENFSIHVWPLLEFANPPALKVITWNPSNPSIILTAPDVNRPEAHKVTYEWRKGQTLIGYGKVIGAPLNAGKNVFLLRAIDQDMIGARSSEVEIVVECE